VYHKRLSTFEFHSKCLIKRFIFHQCGLVVFLSKQLNNEVMHNMVNKTMECHLFHVLVEAITIIAKFNLWMF